MSDENAAVLELTDDELDEYLQVSLANGFSKGTANVSPADMKKLRGLLKHYASKPHPFTTCVRDQIKHGLSQEHAEKRCAVIKDLIRGTTKWRSTERKKHLSDEEREALALDVDKLDVEYLLEFSDVTELQAEDLEEDFPGTSDEQRQFLAEMYLAEGDVDEANGLIWKTVLREGDWAFSPGPGGHEQQVPISVKKDGSCVYSDKEIVISMSELLENFRDEAVEHVTIPTSHQDKVLENTGYIRDLRMAQDEEGRWVLQAAHEFTEPDVREKALRGTIANTSAGILFDYVKKEIGKKYRAVLAHVALTNKPWLNGMKPFGVHASDDNVTVVAFSEASTEEPADAGGGDKDMADEDKTVTLAEEVGLSDDEIKARLARYEELEREQRTRNIEDKVKSWEGEGKPPALLKVAKDVMMADKGAPALNLSEDGRENALTATDIVERLIAASPSVKLSEDPVTDEDTSKDLRPDDDATTENEYANLSADERSLATQLFLEGHLVEGRTYTQKEAVEEAKKRLATDDKN